MVGLYGGKKRLKYACVLQTTSPGWHKTGITITMSAKGDSYYFTSSVGKHEQANLRNLFTSDVEQFFI